MEIAFILFSLILSFVCVAITAFFTYKFNKINSTLNGVINAHNEVANTVQKLTEVYNTHNETLKTILDAINNATNKPKDNTKKQSASKK